MELFSLQFVAFVSLLLLLYYSVCKKYQWGVLLVASLSFYLMYSSFCIIFLIVTSVSVWKIALIIEGKNETYKVNRKQKGLSKEEKETLKEAHIRNKRWMLFATIMLNVLILAYFKYWNPILRLFAIDEQNVLYKPSSLLLPLGISFYTFQAISYFMDIYNGKYKAEQNFAKFLLYISFFPQLIQGPINRFDQMKEQFFSQHQWDCEQAKRAVLLILFGLMKKFAIANLLVDKISFIFDNPVDNLSGNVIIFGILMYSAQQYADFSGGIDIVIGVAQLFGIHMSPNFRQPYFSVSLADFWRRWHISLGSWMRDYVFYPIAITKTFKNITKSLNKKGKRHLALVLPAAFANIVVFLVVGIWHGAYFHYIIWGLYNGLIIALSDILVPYFEQLSNLLKINTNSKGHHLFRIIHTFIIVNIGWYFDRIENIRDCFLCLKNSVVHFTWNIEPVASFVNEQFVSWSILVPIIIICAIIIVFVDSILRENGVDVYGQLLKQRFVIRYGICLGILFLTLLSFMYSYVSGGFLYANF